MSNIREIHFLDIGEDAQRQYIDAQSVFTAWEDVKKAAAEVRGGMYWQTKNGKDYLIRTAIDNSQKSLGPRSEENEAIYKKFSERKEQTERRLTDLNAELIRHQRMNRALRVGRAPRLLIEILDRLYRSGLSEYFTVIGTWSLYAYESAVGVRCDPEVLATRDLDLLWDNCKMKSLDTTFLGLLKKIDSTFEIRSDQRHTAVNSKGFEVDIICGEGKDAGPLPLKISEDGDDFYVIQEKRAGLLLDSSRFSSMVVSTSGHMARMRTISPTVFVRLKRWMAEQPDRDPLKRRKDVLQAEVVEKLVEECLPAEIRG
jgi:hypothetical protein